MKWRVSVNGKRVSREKACLERIEKEESRAAVEEDTVTSEQVMPDKRNIELKAYFNHRKHFGQTTYPKHQNLTAHPAHTKHPMQLGPSFTARIPFHALARFRAEMLISKREQSKRQTRLMGLVWRSVAGLTLAPKRMEADRGGILIPFPRKMRRSCSPIRVPPGSTKSGEAHLQMLPAK